MDKIYQFLKKAYVWPVILCVIVMGIILFFTSFYFSILKPNSSPIKYIPIRFISRDTGLQIQKVEKFNEISSSHYFVPILVFHHIDTAPARMDSAGKSLFVEPAQLEKILVDLQKNNYQPVFVSEIATYLANDEKPPSNIVALTFDDGYENFYTNAWPLLQKYKIKSSIFIMTGAKGKKFLTPQQIIDLDKSNLVEIGSHTVYHPHLDKLSQKDQYDELKNSKDTLEKLLGKEIDGICYPFGVYNPQIEDLAKVIGYKFGLAFNHLPLEDTTDVFSIDRVGVWPKMNVISYLQNLNKVSK